MIPKGRARHQRDESHGAMNNRLAIAIGLACALPLAYGAGVLSSVNDWPPSRTIKAAYADTINLARNWRNDLGIEPTRLLVPAPDPGPAPLADAGPAEGVRLVAGVTSDKTSRFGVRLLDRDGNETHFWPVHYDDLSAGETSERNVFLHGVAPLPDGSIVVNFDSGDTIARIGLCGDTLWTATGNFHHGIHRSHDGTLWTWQNIPATEEGAPDDEHIIQVDPATGRPLRRISLLDDVIRRHRLHGIFAIHSEPATDRIAFAHDPFHPNDVEVLDPATARAFPMFAAGDLLISLRSLNLVAVLDGDTLAPKWSRIGPWHRQHDPDFLPDGTISVLDNAMGTGASRILAVDPATDAITTVFDGAGHGDFYTWQRGRHQTLANGNLVIAESQRGRAIEVNRAGDLVWRYENVFDAGRNGLISEVAVLPPGFLDEDALRTCRPVS